MKHLLTLRETSAADIRYLLETATALKRSWSVLSKRFLPCAARAMITLFMENSTRTRTSFEMAAKIMSAEAINIAVAQFLGGEGESLQDTLSPYRRLKADCIRDATLGVGCGRSLRGALADPGGKRGATDGIEHPLRGLLDIADDPAAQRVI